MKQKIKSSANVNTKVDGVDGKRLAHVKDGSYKQWNFYDTKKKGLDTTNSTTMKSANVLAELPACNGPKGFPFRCKMTQDYKKKDKEIICTSGPSFKHY